MEFDLVVNEESIERCFLEYDEIGYGFDEDINGNVVNFAEATISQVTWYKNNDDCDVDDVVTIQITEIHNSNSYNTIVQWHDESFKNNINAVRLLKEAKSDLLNEFSKE
ncbi:hypothetical protein [Rummeliibacillus stabekisii]|uniref:Uncharacterized protein n=1 Tax=Rummeliibacillus stabekisii TaxID=241244 RepID=A0A143H8W5_9BACL|nr:hypothetical protein [Rummeliibacillus stabekisii]AMW97946.1 hypothetical protein ATY39_00095 [Rummeliibacillus stabekisii]